MCTVRNAHLCAGRHLFMSLSFVHLCSQPVLAHQLWPRRCFIWWKLYLNATRGDQCAGFERITGVTFCHSMTNYLKKIRKTGKSMFNGTITMTTQTKRSCDIPPTLYLISKSLNVIPSPRQEHILPCVLTLLKLLRQINSLIRLNMTTTTTTHQATYVIMTPLPLAVYVPGFFQNTLINM